MAQAGPPDMSKILSSLSATKYATVASAALLVYDIIITFDQEVHYVWNARKSWGTTIFFLNRYIPPCLFALDLYAQLIPSASLEVSFVVKSTFKRSLLRLLGAKFCKNYELSSTILDLVPITVIESVLIMRTNALYQRRDILFSLSFLAVASIVNMLVCFLVVFRLETFVPAKTIGLSGCLSGCTSPLCQPILVAFWVPFLLLETLVFFLTIWKSYETTKTKFSHGASILDILARDGVIYYVVILAISLCNFIIWIIDPFASYLAVGLLKSLQSTICSRLLLNLRGLLAVDDQPYDIQLKSGSYNGSISLRKLPKLRDQQAV